jgi:translation initiation factor IF-2
MDTKQANQPQPNAVQFPPVVAVLGHVDHGKTTLLDTIRKTTIADREHGGITQRIGASKITIPHEGKQRSITFIDTPGHEAFSTMRGRGAQAADIGILVVSAADGVMPQTRESIAVLKQAGIPFIVALTKADLDTAIPEKVKQQLLQEQVMLEGYGGDIPVIEVSAKTNLNIKELLDLILLVQDLHADNFKHISETGPVKAIVIESKLDQKAGPRATVIIKNGTIHTRDVLYIGDAEGKVRSLLNYEGKPVQEATVGEAVEILGFTLVPAVGSLVSSEKNPVVEIVSADMPPKPYLAMKKGVELSVVLLADTLGSLEAIHYALPEGLDIIAEKTGEITEADILLAKSTGSIVLGFNTKIRPDVEKLAMTEKVLAKNYTIIYEMLDEIRDVIEGKVHARMEQIFGQARILASFPYEKSLVLGVAVQDGRIARGDKIRLLRGEETVGESTITSLRQGKNQTSKVEKGQEAGIIITPALDFQVGDVVLSHS